MKNLSVSAIEKMSVDERIKYFQELKDYCGNLKNWFPKVTPQNLPCTLFVEIKGLSFIERALMKGANATLIERANKNSALSGLFDLTNKIINGDTGVIFGEGTWNLHPVLPMQKIKTGGILATAISGKPLIPAIFEYLEVKELCSKESELYSKCVVRFGEPIKINPAESIIFQTNQVQEKMEAMRRRLWKENGIKRESLDDIQPTLYVNHTGLKVYGGTAKLDYEREKACLYSTEGTEPEFMYTIDEDGNLVPGELTEETFLQITKHSLQHE